MTTIKQEAEAFAGNQVRNIAELGIFSIEQEIKTETGKNKKGEEFIYKYIEIKGIKYRIPFVVLGDIKGILKELPNTKTFKVIKSGDGLTTKYQVVPVLN